LSEFQASGKAISARVKRAIKSNKTQGLDPVDLLRTLIGVANPGIQRVTTIGLNPGTLFTFGRASTKVPAPFNFEIIVYGRRFRMSAQGCYDATS
jgi:hypothetical protein